MSDTAPRVMVEIIRYDDDEVIKSMGPMSRWEAEKVDRGANINLNHESYYTRIREVEAEKAS